MDIKFSIGDFVRFIRTDRNDNRHVMHGEIVYIHRKRNNKLLVYKIRTEDEHNFIREEDEIIKVSMPDTDALVSL